MTRFSAVSILVSITGIVGCGAAPGAEDVPAEQTESSLVYLCNNKFSMWSLGAITTPSGVFDPLLDNPTVGDFQALARAGACDGSGLLGGGGYRTLVVQKLLDQVDFSGIGRCADDAVSWYDAGAEWCTEFARDVFLWSGCSYNGPGAWRPDGCGVVRDVSHTIGPFNKEYLHDVGDVGDIRGLFQTFRGGWRDRGLTNPVITPYTPEPGDYVAMDNGTGDTQAHSAVVVAITADTRWIWLIEGNVRDERGKPCVRLEREPWYNDAGQLDPKFGAIGKINTMFIP